MWSAMGASESRWTIDIDAASVRSRKSLIFPYAKSGSCWSDDDRKGLNWKLVTTFWRDLPLCKLHKDTCRLTTTIICTLRSLVGIIGLLLRKPRYSGNAQSARKRGYCPLYVCAYHLFPNIQLITSHFSTTLIRIYPVKDEPGRLLPKSAFTSLQRLPRGRRC